MPASGSTAGRASTIERENYSNNAAWIDTQAGLAGGTGLTPNRGYAGTAKPVSSALNAHLTSATVTGNDAAGSIVLVVDGTGIAQNQTLCLITFNSATLYTNVPIVNLVNMTPGAGSTTLFAGTYAPLTTTALSFSIVALGALLTASGTFTVGYTVTGTG